MTPPGQPVLARRRFLTAAGALVLSFTLRPLALAAADAVPGQRAQLPGSLKSTDMLDAWIRLDAGGAITVFTGKAELGQGIKTALMQIAAEELLVAPEQIHLVTADTALTPDEKYTAGSHSMQDSGTAIRHASAQVRSILFGLAAQRLGAPFERLRAAGGVISAPDGQRVSYGELISGQQLHMRAAPQSALIDPKAHRLVGRPVPRVDIPAKVSGGPAYVQDLRLPGMLHGRVVRPPGPGAALRQFDAGAAAGLPGVLKVVRDGRFIGVIASGQYQAIKAAALLARAAQWDEPATLPAQDGPYPDLQAQASQDTVILQRGSGAGGGDGGGGGGGGGGNEKGAAGGAGAAGSAGDGARRNGNTSAASAGRTLEARYRRSYQLHGSIGPSCAVAQYADGQYTVWTHSQGVYPLRAALAEMLGVAPDTVRCIHMEGSGCYGHNGADDVAADAVLLARTLPGKPVRVQWMREDEHAWEPYGPPMTVHVKATLDGAGNITDWRYHVWSPPHNARPGAAGNLLAATLLAQAFTPPPAKPIPPPEGGGDRNAIPLYTLPAIEVTHHFLPSAPLRVSALRSLGAYWNVFAIESFMDELARAARADPVAFRLRHMTDPRAREVMQLAAARFGWDGYRRQPGRGRGYAFARYKNLGAYAAVVLEVEVARESGYVRITRAVVAVDSGEVVNPDGIRNQIEGGLLQSCSWTLCEEVTFDRQRVTSRDWAGYPILRFPQMPDSVEVHIIDRPGQPFLGTGEASQGPAAAALANAVADATGQRKRDVPLRRDRVRAQLALK